MGFQEMLTGGQPALIRLQSYYEKVLDYLSYKGTFVGKTFKFLLVSDAIVLSVALPEKDGQKRLECCHRFFSAISLLQYIFAVEQDIWLRGAVSVGDLYIDDNNILIGPAFVRAWQLEKVADYPRVIVDPAICGRCELNPNQFTEKINSLAEISVLVKDPKGVRMGRQPYIPDAIQIDWFRHALDRQDHVDKFFDGLKRRLTENQVLYQKSMKLGRYLRESFDVASHDNKATSGAKPERVSNIDSILKDLGF